MHCALCASFFSYLWEVELCSKLAMCADNQCYILRVLTYTIMLQYLHNEALNCHLISWHWHLQIVDALENVWLQTALLTWIFLNLIYVYIHISALNKLAVLLKAILCTVTNHWCNLSIFNCLQNKSWIR